MPDLLFPSCPTRTGISLATARVGRGRVYKITALQSALSVNADNFPAKTVIPPSAFTVKSIQKGDFV